MHRVPRTLVTLTALASSGGCLVPSDSQLPEPIPTDLEVPAEVIASFARALEGRDLDAYVALLELPSERIDEPLVGFQFRAPDRFSADDVDDLADFPWLPNGPLVWGFDEEVASIGALFDPAYRGSSPPVASIEARFDVLRETERVGSPLLDVAARIRVRDVSGAERFAETRFELWLVPDSYRYLRIHHLNELEIGQLETWTGIRRLYPAPQ